MIHTLRVTNHDYECASISALAVAGHQLLEHERAKKESG
jgi:hypothetical protein